MKKQGQEDELAVKSGKKAQREEERERGRKEKKGERGRTREREGKRPIGASNHETVGLDSNGGGRLLHFSRRSVDDMTELYLG